MLYFNLEKTLTTLKTFNILKLKKYSNILFCISTKLLVSVKNWKEKIFLTVHETIHVELDCACPDQDI